MTPKTIRFKWAVVHEGESGCVTIRGHSSWDDAAGSMYYNDTLVQNLSVTVEDNLACLKGKSRHLRRHFQETRTTEELLEHIEYDESHVSMRYPMFGGPRKELVPGIYIRKDAFDYELWTNNFKIRPYHQVEVVGDKE